MQMVIFDMMQTSRVLFFSSRRRHTRWNCDWSSDVCSSDLLALVHPPQALDEPGGVQAGGDQRGLAGVAVAGDPDGADGFSRIHLHRILPLEACLPAASFSLTGLRVTFPPTCPEPSRGKPAG